jgi:hypothetical protein
MRRAVSDLTLEKLVLKALASGAERGLRFHNDSRNVHVFG